MKQIIEDERKIKYICTENISFCQGKEDWEYDKIEPYQECGEMSMITWFSLWKGDEIKNRVPARAVTSIEYYLED